MNNDEQQYLQQLEGQLEQEKLKSMQMQREYGQQAFSQMDSSNLIQYQLDLKPEMEDIKHLINNEIIKIDKDGNEYWDKSEEVDSRVVSSSGAENIMSILSFVVNKSTILSAFKEEEVNLKMAQIKEEIADEIFNRYEVIFYKPEIEELIYRDLKRIQKYKERLEEINSIPDSENLNILKDKYRGTLQDKIDYIKERTKENYDNEADRIFDSNIKRYPLLVLLICEAINSAYNRAIRGEERSSLRRTHYVSESINPQARNGNTTDQKSGAAFSVFKPSTWIKRY